MAIQNNEISLVKKAKKGHKNAFTGLIVLYSEDAYRVAFSYLRNEMDSKDALAAGIEKAFLHIKKLDKEAYFKSWFIKIVVNEALMLIRKNQKDNCISLDDYEQDIVAPKTLATEERMDLNHALSLLAPMDRGLVMGKYYLEYTFKELSEVYNLPESTIKSRIYKLLEHLKIELQEREDYYEQNSL